jgi:hypothetical protein
MKKILLLGCVMVFIFCGGRKTTVQTEGLEEVVVFEEEEGQVSTEPVYPTPPGEEEAVEPPPVAEEPLVEETPVVEEEIAVIPPVEEEIVPPPIVEEEPYVSPVEEVPEPTTPAAPAKLYGFRVQIFASSTENNAQRVAEDARSSFQERVYVEYVPPYYKVRVGNCLTENEAQSLKNKALQFGYRGAFIVETMVTP